MTEPKREQRTDRDLGATNRIDLVERVDNDTEFVGRVFAEAQARMAERAHVKSLNRLRERCGMEPLPPKSWTWADRLRGRKLETPTFAQRLRGEL